MTSSDTQQRDLELTTKIVAAYVAKNPLPAHVLPELIARTAASVHALSQPAQADPQKPIPAVGVKKSVTEDYIVCLEDGKKFRSLKRHIMSRYGLTPEAYRAKWSLPDNYPMVAPSYSARRSELAKNSGLGKKAQPVKSRKMQRA